MDTKALYAHCPVTTISAVTAKILSLAERKYSSKLGISRSFIRYLCGNREDTCTR